MEVEGDKGGPVTVFIITEAVQPLSLVLHDLGLQGAQRCVSSPWQFTSL